MLASILSMAPKYFLHGGQHELAENIIHPVLARVPSVPSGSRGFSLFVVPKYLLKADCGIGGPQRSERGEH